MMQCLFFSFLLVCASLRGRGCTLQRPFFAMEPVFNANNGINLFSQGYQGSGITVLGPGETLCGDMRIEWQLL